MFGTLRTLLALNVVLLHIFNVPTLGNYSVMAFFILSGFLMTLVMNNSYGYTVRGFKYFWYNRFLRLFPIYWVLVLSTIIFILLPLSISHHPHIAIPNTFGQWVANLTMIYPETIPHRYLPRLIPPSWALTNELIYYLLISFGISKNIKRTLIWIGLGILYFVYTYLFKDLPTYRYSYVIASSLPFSIGALLFYLSKYIRMNSEQWVLPIFTFILFIGNAIFLSGKMIAKIDIGFYLNMLISAVLIYQLYFLTLGQTWKKWDTYLGYYSYPIYLGHYFCAMLFSITFQFGIVEDGFKLKLSAIVPFLLFLFIICLILVHMIDKPVNRIKKNLNK